MYFENNPNIAIVSPNLREAIKRNPDWRKGGRHTLDGSSISYLRTLALGVMVEFSYHNRCHTTEMVDRLVAFFKAAKFDSHMKSVMLAAAWCHDAFHSGVTYRQLTACEEFPRLSNEEYTAYNADIWLRSIKVPVRERVMVQGFILSSSYQQLERNNPPAGLARPYRPSNKWELVFKLADVGNFVKPFEQWLFTALAVKLETPDHESWETFSEWISGELCYLQEMEILVSSLVDTLSEDTVAKLRGSLAGHRRRLERIEQDSPEFAKHYEIAKQQHRNRSAHDYHLGNRYTRRAP